jgi:hypothetical protein
VRRLLAAGRRAFEDNRHQDATDFLIAEQIVCILRGDFSDDEVPSRAWVIAPHASVS